MKVVLLKDVKKLGKAEDIVEVTPGYANNYLFRNNLAVPLTAENLNTIKTRRQAAEAKAQKEHAEALAIKEMISGQHFTLLVKTGTQGRLYGSVTNMDIASVLEKAGYKVDRRGINVSEPIKKTGEYNVDIRIHPEVNAQFVLDVVSEEA